MEREMKTLTIIFVCLLCGCNSSNLENEEYFNGYMDGFMEAHNQVRRVNDALTDLYASQYLKNGLDTLVCLYPAEIMRLSFRTYSLVDITDEQLNNKKIFNNYQNWLRRR